MEPWVTQDTEKHGGDMWELDPPSRYMPWAYDMEHLAQRNNKAMMNMLKDLDSEYCQCPFGAAGKEVTQTGAGQERGKHGFQRDGFGQRKMNN